MKVTEAQVLEGLKKRGVPDHVAKGVVMNFRDESALNTSIEEGADNVHGTRGYGIAQWTDRSAGNGRRTALNQFAASSGRAADDLDTQLDFFMHENETSEKGAWATVMAAGNAEDAAVAFVNNWERPAEKHAIARSAKYKQGYVPTKTGPGYIAAEEAETHGMVTPSVAVPNVEAPSWGDLAGAALGESTVAQVYNNWTRPPQLSDPDPEFNLDAVRLETVMKERGLNIERYAGTVGSAINERDLEFRLLQSENAQKNVQVLEAGGWAGTGMQMLVSMAEELPLDIALGAVAPQVVGAKYASRAARALSLGVSTGAVAAAAGSANAYYNPNQDASDVALSTGMAVVFGGAVGSLMRNPALAREAMQLNTLGREVFEGVSGPVDTIAAQANVGSVGAASAPSRAEHMMGDISRIADDSIDHSAKPLKIARLDATGQLGTSPNPLSRVLSGLGYESVGKQGHAVVARSVAEDKTLTKAPWDASAEMFIRDAAEVQSKLDKSSIWDARDKTSDMVWEAVQDDGADWATKYPDHIRKAASEYRRIEADIATEKNNPFRRDGIPAGERRSVGGHEELRANKTYIRSEFLAPKVRATEAKFGASGIETLFDRAIQAANATLPAELRTRIAKGATASILRRSAGLSDNAPMNMAGDSFDDLVDFLKHNTDIDPEDLDKLSRYHGDAQALNKKTKDKGTGSSNKRRMVMDRKMTVDVQTLDGTGVAKLGFKDLLNTDAFGLLRRDIDSSAADIAFARFRPVDKNGNVLYDGLTNAKEIEKAITDDIAERAAASGDPKMIAAVAVDQKNAKFMVDSLYGRDFYNQSSAARTASSLARSLQFYRLMGQSFWNSLQESTRIAQHAGIKAAFSQMPALRDLYRLSRGGGATRPEFVKSMNAYGMGVSQHMTDRFLINAVDEYGLPTSIGQASKMDRVRHSVQQLNRGLSIFTGQMALEEGMREWVGKAILQNWWDMAQKGKLPLSKNRLASYGVTEAEAKEILAELREAAPFKVRKAAYGNVLEDVDFGAFKNPAIREKLITAIHKESSAVVQRNEIGSLHRYLSHEGAKIFTQFRVFNIGAWTNGLMRSAHQHDKQALKNLVFGSSMAAATYMARIAANDLFKEEKNELFDEDGQLSFNKIAGAAISRIPEASILPGIIDSAITTAGADPLFSGYRTTGQSQDLFGGSPLGSHYKDLKDGVGGLMESFIHGGTYSQQDAKALRRAVLTNALPIMLLTNPLIDDLPEFDPRGE